MWRLPFYLLCLVLSSCALTLTVSDLKCEYLDNPVGIDTTTPRFSWSLSADVRGIQQFGYQILIGENGKPDGSTWDSGKIISAQSFNIPYAGFTLRPAGVYTWTVQVWANGTQATPQSPGRFVMGLPYPSFWHGKFIGLPSSVSECPWYRKGFALDPAAKVYSAVLYVASLGYHEAYINSKPVSEAVLSPSVSLLSKRVLYRAYDVADLLRPGQNAVGLWLGPGWAMFPAYNTHQIPLVLAELWVNTSLGLTGVSTGSDWRVHTSNTKHIGTWVSDNYGGDLIDDRLYINNWNGFDFDDSSWPTATTYNLSVEVSADVMEPTVIQSSLIAKSVQPAGTNSFLVEFPEVFSGWFEVRNLVGDPGASVNFRVSTTAGVPMEYNMEDRYIFSSSGRGGFRMRFSFHEIQYITIDGLKQAPELSDIIGYRLTSNFTRTGQFTSSNELITKMYNITVNNYQGITWEGKSVDCPHRERLGYGGDGHTSFQFAIAHFGVGAFFTKWAQDWADIQEPNGHIANTAPTLIGGGGPAWGGFAVTMPWQMYINYGDTNLLKQMYPTMIRLLGFFAQQTHSDGLLHNWTSSQWDFLGDWITPHGSENIPGSPECLLFNNCYLHYITQLVAKISRVLGNSTGADFYDDAANKLAIAINKAWLNQSSGVYLDMLQTHIAMPLATGVVPASSVATVVSNLEHSIQVLQKGHLDTGLTGTYFMTKVLTELPRNDLVFTYLTQLTFPGYGYFVQQGFTTWPEDWQAEKGVSKMHGCYNAIGLWFTEGVVGIRVDFSDPSVPPFRFRAGADIGDITWSSGSRASPFGVLYGSWFVSSERGFEHNITVPVNSRARVLIPAASVEDVKESGKPISAFPEISYVGMAQEGSLKLVVLDTLSGEFQFTSSWTK